jgi:hypothetical protein
MEIKGNIPASEFPKLKTEDYQINVKCTAEEDPFMALGLGKVRYSRFNNLPKNTLYTISAEGVVFFGISRCNPTDVCIKTAGRKLAFQRAVEALHRYQHNRLTVAIDPDGLSGQCTVEAFPIVRDYFFGLDAELRAEEFPTDDLDLMPLVEVQKSGAITRGY